MVGDTELSFVNEYMTVEAGGERLATFPDLITTLSPETGNPVSVAQLREGREVCVLVVDKDRVPLGSGVREPEGSPEVEAMTARSSGAMLWHREVPDRGTLR